MANASSPLGRLDKADDQTISPQWRESLERLVSGQGLDPELRDELERNAAMRESVDAIFRVRAQRLAQVAKAMREVIEDAGSQLGTPERQGRRAESRRSKPSRSESGPLAKGLAAALASLFSRPREERQEVIEETVAAIEHEPDLPESKMAISAARSLASR